MQAILNLPLKYTLNRGNIHPFHSFSLTSMHDRQLLSLEQLVNNCDALLPQHFLIPRLIDFINVPHKRIEVTEFLNL
jgi:hypothetical protein